MESGKIEVAGPSSGRGEVEKQEEMMKEEARAFDEEEDDEEDGHQEYKGAFGNFDPGPLLPLKEQIEKDKVQFFTIFLASYLYLSSAIDIYFSLVNCCNMGNLVLTGLLIL